MDRLVELSCVSKSFGPVEVLRQVNLDVYPGQVAAIAGPNGSGKSTLLRIIATLVRQDTGVVRVGGFDVRHHGREVRRRIGVLLTEERAWYWRLSGAENLRFFGALHGLRSAAAKARAAEVLELVDLNGAGDRQVGTYSSGMRMRLALARALLPRPSVLILDEPTRSADADAKEVFRDLIRAQAESGVATVLATHDPSEIYALSAAVTLLHAGASARSVEIRSLEQLTAAMQVAQ
jgi:ABC-2 type transport system ATP-binding protein